MATLPRITYPDKVDYQIQGKDSKYGISAKDMNEIKNTFNQSADGIENLMSQNEQIESDLNSAIDTLNVNIQSGEFIPNITIGTVEKGEVASVTIRGTKENPIIDLILPKGDQGDQGIQGVQGIQGESNVLTVGNVTVGEMAQVEITGESPNQVINFTIPKGEKGDKGDPNSLAIGSVTTGETVSAEIVGKAPNQFLNLVLKQGEKGDKGEKGDGILTPHIVTELPTVGETSDIYFLVDGESYISYMYVEDKWIKIGSGNVDLSGYYTKTEVDEKALMYDIAYQSYMIPCNTELGSTSDYGDYVPLIKQVNHDGVVVGGNGEIMTLNTFKDVCIYRAYDQKTRFAVQANDVTEIVKLTLAEFDALATKAVNTMYLILEG